MTSGASKAIMVVEDELMIAYDIEACLEEKGHRVVSIVSDLDQAQEALHRHRPDFVVLDAELKGRSAAGFAQDLRRRGVPFVVVSGYSSAQCEWLADVVLLRKPFEVDRLLAEVGR